MNSLQVANQIEKLCAKQGGVITSNEVGLIADKKYPRSFYNLIKELQEAHILRKYIRGVYVTQTFDSEVLFQKINPESYISFENILSKNLLIGSGAKYSVRGVRVGRTRVYNNLGLRLEYVGTQRNHFFGFEVISGVSRAYPEKAFVDCAFYYLRGMKLNFDIYTDVNVTELNAQKMFTYLEKYKNPKFKAFFQKLYEGYPA